MKTFPYLLSVALVFLFTGFTTDNSDSTDTFQSRYTTFYYPSSTLKTMLSQGNGVRLYNASFPSNGGVTLMAVAVTGQVDTRQAPYYVFNGISSGQVTINSIELGSATEACRNLGNAERFAVTLNENDVTRLLSQSGATGISFDYATNSMGYRTLKVSPAALQGRDVMIVNQSASYVVENPCPVNCGSDAQVSFLCDMQ